jgi:hypothetical protein
MTPGRTDGRARERLLGAAVAIGAAAAWGRRQRQRRRNRDLERLRAVGYSPQRHAPETPSALSRGHYCPKEHQQHLQLAAFYPQVAVAYTQTVTISTDAHHELQEFRASVGAQWTFLSDPGRIIQKDLDIQEYTDPEHDPMIPHTLVLKPGLVIHSIYNGYWFWGRPPSRTSARTCERSPARSTPTGT